MKIGSLGLISPWIAGPIVFAIWVAVFAFLIKVAFAGFRSLAKKTKTEIDDILIFALRTPLLLLVLASGGIILARILPLSTEWDNSISIGVKIVVILSGFLFADGLVTASLKRAHGKISVSEGSIGIFQTAIRGIVILIAALVVLSTLGISITPLIASLGVGSLAVALALQSPLANFFAGIQILADKSIDIGQYIRLETGEEGYVTKIGWRATTIRALPNNLIVIPNSKITSSIITNYYLPEKELSVIVQVGVHYDSDLEHVEKVVCEVAKEVLQTIPGGKKDFEPFIRYHTFGDSSIQFSVILRVEEFVNGYLVKHEFIKKIHKRFKQEGIVIPFPIRTLHMQKEDLLILKGEKMRH
ncbi:MAG: mechanosensitive ion channel family protein [bacterium]